MYLLQMQKNSNLRRPLKNETSAKKKYFTVNIVHLIHRAYHMLSTFINQCHCLHFTVSAFIFLTFTPNIPILFTAIPQHIIGIIHCTGYTAVLKSFTITSGEMCCHVVMIHTD